MTISQPEHFNEKFTVCLDTSGQPVQRALIEMTAPQVVQAMEWQEANSDRLCQKSDQTLRVATALLTRAKAGEKLAAEEFTIFKNAADASERAEAELKKTARLMKLVMSRIPHRYSYMPISERLRRSRVSGRAA